jgi:hypothetical protein
MVDMEAGDQMTHGEQKHGHTERGADPETPSHVFGIIAFCVGFRAASLWFQCHAADRAVAGMVLLNLRMHRAGVDGFLRRLPHGIAFQGHAAFGAIARLVRLDAMAHGAEVFRRSGRLHRCLSRVVTTRVFFRGVLVMFWLVCAH